MTDQAGRDELHYATVEGDVVRVRRLLEEGCDPNVVDLHGFAPLHFAAQSYEPSVVAVLIEFGADIDKANGVGNTALGLAVFHSEGRGEVIEQLLAAGADADRENSAGISPRVLAERIANYDVKRFFPAEPA